MKRRGIVIAALTLSLVAAGATGYTFLNRKGKPEFERTTVTRDDVEVSITATGGVQPQNRLEIKPPVAGRIEQILFREGTQVTKGAVLAWMSSSERVALIDAARSRGPAEVKRWEEMYRRTPIVAPMSGILIARKVESGQTVTLQDVALVMSNSLIVRADVDETDISKIKVGQAATLTLDAYPKEVIKATVDHIAFDAKTANNVTVYSIDLLPASVPDFMRSGMSANVTFEIDHKADALVVRADAVKTGRDGKFVLVPSDDENGRPNRVAVSTGITDGKIVEITSGLTEDAVVLVPLMRLSEKRPGGGNPFSPFGGRPPRR